MNSGIGRSHTSLIIQKNNNLKYLRFTQSILIFLSVLTVGMFFIPIAIFAKQTSTENIINFSVNGSKFKDGTIDFFPGYLNNLKVNPEWDLITASDLDIQIIKTHPNCKKDIYKETILKNENFEINLGPMTSPPLYEFISGDVYQIGYQLEISINNKESSENQYQILLNQGLSSKASTMNAMSFLSMKSGRGKLFANQKRKVLYNPMYGIDASLGLKLNKNVLNDEDDLRIEYRITPGAPANKLKCRLNIRDQNGHILINKILEVKQSDEWQTEFINPEMWNPGDYEISLHPEIKGEIWEEGPIIIYRRKDKIENEISISPYAPWTLMKDSLREELVITDFSDILSDYSRFTSGWEFASSEEGVAAYNKADAIVEPLEIELPLKGYYAIFAQPFSEDGCIIQVTDKSLIRVVSDKKGHGPDKNSTIDSDELIFVEAADLGDNHIKLFGFSRDTEISKSKISGIKKLVLIPVTAMSVDSFYQRLFDPPVTLNGINDWADYFHLGNGSVRLEADQFETLFGAQAELGLDIDWSIGRSWIEYKSDLPETSRFPAISYEKALKTDSSLSRYEPRILMINKFDPLDEVISNKKRFQKNLVPWLGMNRHYGVTSYGGMFSSEWFKNNRQWWQWLKNSESPRGSAVCYYFPEVRKERTDILLEVIKRDVDGVLIGTCRQVPMLLYHPKMVSDFKNHIGIDPLNIDGTHPDYIKWITWRADFFTEVLRELKKEISGTEKRYDKKLNVSVRIPSSGLFENLAQGLDIKQWLEESLIDRLQLVPLEDRGGEGAKSHNIDPYVLLGEKYKISIFGGIGATWTSGQGAGIVPSLYRAIGLIDAGVKGIEIYESNDHAFSHRLRWVIPLFGNREEAISFLKISNIEAVYPITPSTAMFGYDNHSSWSLLGWDIYGEKGNKL